MTMFEKFYKKCRMEEKITPSKETKDADKARTFSKMGTVPEKSWKISRKPAPVFITAAFIMAAALSLFTVNAATGGKFYKELSEGIAFLVNGNPVGMEIKSQYVTQDGRTCQNIDMDYEGSFKAIGLQIDKDSEGRISLTPNEENPDIYYYTLTYSDAVQKFAHVFDEEGNVRVVMGEEADDIELKGNEDGIVYSAAPGEYKCFQIDWESRDWEKLNRLPMYRIGGNYSTFFGKGHDGSDIVFVKKWYGVSRKAMEIIDTPELEYGNYDDIFEDENGDFIYYYSDDGEELQEEQGRWYGR